MPTVRVVDGIERFVLCDPSAPSQWVPAATTTNGEAQAQAPDAQAPGGTRLLMRA